MDIVTIILSLVLVLIPMLILFKRIQRKQRIASIIDKLPGPKAYPIVGTTFAFVGVPKEKLFTKFHERTVAFYPGPFRTWLGMSPSVHLLKAEHIEVIMSSQKHITKGAQYKFLEPWLGLGLLTSTGAKWHSHRKMITPAFHFRILDIFIDIFFEKSNILVNKLKPLADGRVFDIYPFITHCALDIICETAMGVEMNAQNNTTSDYVSAVYEVSDLSMKRSITPWLHPDFVWKRSEMGQRYNQCLEVLHGFTNKIIKERKATLETGVVQSISENKIEDDDCYGKKKRLAFLDLLLEASQGGTKLTDVEIREETDTFMFEGHDTTTAGICWSLFLLGNNLEIQEKIFAELDDIFQGSDRPTTKQDLNEMKYLERAIKEALRLYPSVPVIVRKLYEDIEIAGYEIPKETLVVLHIFESQRDPDHFPDPNVFDPDNFLPENIQKRHPYAFVPFSAGPRNCIGQKFALYEEKAVLSTILRKYKVKSLEKPEDLSLQASLILRPASGIKVQLEPRVY